MSNAINFLLIDIKFIKYFVHIFILKFGNTCPIEKPCKLLFIINNPKTLQKITVFREICMIAQKLCFLLLLLPKDILLCIILA